MKILLNRLEDGLFWTLETMLVVLLARNLTTPHVGGFSDAVDTVMDQTR